MPQKLRSHLTYANVMATIAVFIALGGTGAWATHEVILSSDIVDGEVKTPDLANLGVTGAKLAPSSVGSGKVVDDSLGSADIKDYSLVSEDLGPGEIRTTNIADGTVFTNDVTDGGLRGVDMGIETLTGANVDNGTLTGADIGNESLTSTDIQNFSLGNGDFLTGSVNGRVVTDNSLKDEDIGESTFVRFSASIGTVPGQSCVYRRVTGVNAKRDHLLLTPNGVTTAGHLIYGVQNASSASGFPVESEDAWIVVCNPRNVAIDDGSTEFNLLVINAN